MSDMSGKYFVVQKHRAVTRKGKKKLIRRRFYEAIELEDARGMAKKHAAEHGEDFLVVMVVAEESKPGSEPA